MRKGCGIVIIGLSLLWANCWGATYYLNNQSAGGDGTRDELSGEHAAFATLAAADTALDALGDDGAGDTLIVSEGDGSTYGSLTSGVWAKARTEDYLTIQAATGETPVFTRAELNWNGPEKDLYLHFVGIKWVGEDSEYHFSTRYSNYIKFTDCHFDGRGVDNTGRVLNFRYCDTIYIDSCTLDGGDDTGRYDGFGHGVYFKDSTGLTVTNCTIMQFEGIGIYTECTDVTLNNNEITFFGGDAGIFLGGGTDGATITNNEIHDVEVYYPALSETTTETTWSVDGLTMTNASAIWGSDPYDWTDRMEIVIVSGNNVKTYVGDEGLEGDDNNTVGTIISPTELVLNKSIADGGQPSNVDYYFRDTSHADLIQIGNGGYVGPVTIRGNKLYDVLDGWAFMHLECLYDSDENDRGGINITVENNLCWSVFISNESEQGHPVNMRNTNGVVFRNNTIIGFVQLDNNADVDFKNNVIGYIDARDDGLLGDSDNDYNVINRGAFSSPSAVGAHSTFYENAEYDDSEWTDLFVSYPSNLRPAEGSALINVADESDYVTTEIDGQPRGADPDVGCYEYGVTLKYLFLFTRIICKSLLLG